MSDSEVEPEAEPEPQPRRGRPSGQTDAGKRYRRTAAEISEDKIRVAEMRLQALRETEERKLSNKKPRTKRPRAPVEEVPVKERVRQKEAARDSSPESPPARSFGWSKEELYASWFQ